MVTPQESPVDRRFNAVLNRHLVAFYTIRKLAERNRDMAHEAIESARLGVREWSDVGRRWAKRPGDVAGLLSGAAQAAANGQARSLELLRQWWDGIRELRP